MTKQNRMLTCRMYPFGRTAVSQCFASKDSTKIQYFIFKKSWYLSQ